MKKKLLSIALMGFAFVVHWLPSSTKMEYKKLFIKAPVWAKISIVILTVIFIFQTMASEMKPFIYFQF